MLNRHGLHIPMKQVIVLLVICSIAGFFQTEPVDAQTIRPNLPDADQRPPVPLRPDANAQVVLDSVNILIGTDGSIKIDAKGGPLENTPEFAYDIHIDLPNKMYKTTLIPLSQVEIFPSQQGISGENLNGIRDSSNFSNTIQPLAISPGTYQAKILVQTMDLAFLVLAQTTDYLKWTVSSNGSVQWNAYTDGCAGFTNQIGPIITHWYVSSCSFSAPYYSGGVVYNYAAGSYYNWDWGDPNQSTNSSHTVTVGGKNDGHCTYSWTYSDWGEDALLTWGRRVVVQCP